MCWLSAVNCAVNSWLHLFWTTSLSSSIFVFIHPWLHPSLTSSIPDIKSLISSILDFIYIFDPYFIHCWLYPMLTLIILDFIHLWLYPSLTWSIFDFNHHWLQSSLTSSIHDIHTWLYPWLNPSLSAENVLQMTENFLHLCCINAVNYTAHVLK